MEGVDPLTHLPEPIRQQALERYRLLSPFLEGSATLSALARHHHLPLRTLQRWVKQYREQGLAGLSRRPRSDQDRRHFPAELVTLIEGLALRKPPPTVAWIHRQAVTVASQHAWPSPSYSFVYDVVHHLDPGLVTLAHEGHKAYADRFDLVCRRETSRPNEIWQADHTPLDLLLIREGLPPAKPWLTVILDDYSRAVAGYFLSFESPTALQTALALRQAIWRKEDPRWHVCGIPEILYTDHGSDFTSRHLEQVAADLKIQLIFSTAGVPRGRGKIERFFDTINAMLLCGLSGYAPAGGGVWGEPSLTLSAFDPLLREFLLGAYHSQEHSETKVPPQAHWEAGAFLPRMPDSLEQLDLLLLTVARARKVHPDGIHFQGFRYLDPTLAAYVGEEITLRYDPRDMAEIRVFHRDRFLCRAICPELAGAMIPLREIVQARNRRRQELRKTLTDREQIVQTLLEIHQAGVSSPPVPPPAEPSQPKLKRYFNE